MIKTYTRYTLALGVMLSFLTGTYYERTTVENSSSVSQEELTIPFDEDCTQVMLTIFPILIATSSICFLAPLNTLAILTSKSYLFYLFAIPEAIVFASITLLGYGYHYMRTVKKAKNPVTIFNAEGIWIAEFGLISWNHIEHLSLNMEGAPLLQAIQIKIKKDSLSIVSKQASLAAKSSLLSFSLFKYDYHIGLVSSSFPMEEAVAFSQRYIQT